MLGLARKSDKGAQVRNEVAAYLYDVFTAEDSTLAKLDRWTQQRVINENLAKVSLVLEADDPVEYNYQNLVREIDSEAETGIFLVHDKAADTILRSLARDAGISGKLRNQMQVVAPVFFADELAHSKTDMDMVWVTIEARFDRARIDAMVSGIIMAQLVGDEDSVRDMTDAMRALLYSFHEDLVRRRSGLPLILNDRATRELVTMVSTLADRAGDYEKRVRAICRRAGTY